MSTSLYHCHETLEYRRPSTACNACRSRKVKCSKELPSCANCQACRQTCSYPRGLLKPGPKLGSVHKRRLLNRQIIERHSPCPQKTCEDANRKERGGIDVARGSGVRVQDREGFRRSEHMQTVSELCLPSHEGNSTEAMVAGTVVTDPSLHPGHVLMSACNTLGLSRDVMQQQ